MAGGLEYLFQDFVAPYPEVSSVAEECGIDGQIVDELNSQGLGNLLWGPRDRKWFDGSENESFLGFFGPNGETITYRREQGEDHTLVSIELVSHENPTGNIEVTFYEEKSSNRHYPKGTKLLDIKRTIDAGDAQNMIPSGRTLVENTVQNMTIFIPEHSPRCMHTSPIWSHTRIEPWGETITTNFARMKTYERILINGEKVSVVLRVRTIEL